MSIERCDKHGHWDSDFHESCPRCLPTALAMDEEIVQMQDSYHEKFRRLHRWIIVEDVDGFTVHEWTIDGVAPPSTYPTARLAASRLLQLLRLGPVGPQDHPEDVCVGTVTYGRDQEA